MLYVNYKNHELTNPKRQLQSSKFSFALSKDNSCDSTYFATKKTFANENEFKHTNVHNLKL